MYKLAYGNIFSEKCDLLVIPCNSLGGITGVLAKELKENNIIYNPKTIMAGNVRFVECSSKDDIASVIGFAASTNVLTLGSSKKYIKTICDEVKKYCKNNSLYLVNVPLLGTGAGGLKPKESFEIIRQCFEKEKEININVFVLSKDVYQLLSEGKIKESNVKSNNILNDYKFEYDVALSFAGEDRDYVEKIANALKDKGVRVFYDKFEVSNLFGKDLYQYLSHIYKDTAKYCMIFVSKYYKEKTWTKHELRSAQNRAFNENREYILPVLLEDIQIDGLLDTVGYIKASEYSISEIVEITVGKLDDLK